MEQSPFLSSHIILSGADNHFCGPRMRCTENRKATGSCSAMSAKRQKIKEIACATPGRCLAAGNQLPGKTAAQGKICRNFIAFYFNAVPMAVNFAFIDVPIVVSATTITMLIRAPIRPYSIAVAPVVSLANRRMIFMTEPDCFFHLPPANAKVHLEGQPESGSRSTILTEIQLQY